MNPEVPGGRAPLLACAISHVLGAVLMGTSVDDSDPAGLRDAFRQDATFNVCLGAVFFGLWAWAKSKPLAASVSGLVLFVLAHAVATILNPVNLVFGLVAKSVLLFFLIRSVLAARAAAAWEKMKTRSN